MHPDDRDRLTRAVRDAIEEGVPYSVDFRVLWPDGSVHWLQGAGRRVDDEEGRPHVLVGVARDIDGERAAQASSDEIHALVDAVYSTAPVGLAFVDADLRYVRINEAMAAINERSVSEHLGRTVHEVLADVAPRARRGAHPRGPRHGPGRHRGRRRAAAPAATAPRRPGAATTG